MLSGGVWFAICAFSFFVVMCLVTMLPYFLKPEILKDTKDYAEK